MSRRFNRELLNFWTDKEKKIEGAHLLDLCEEAYKYPHPVWTPFLGIAMRDWLEGICQRGRLFYRIEGGFPESERSRYCLATEENLLEEFESRVSVVKVKTVDPRGTLEHRQILGSLIGLGLKREVIGDIRITQEAGYIAIASEIGDFLSQEWSMAGRERITTEILTGEQDIMPQGGEEKRITSSSPRLDAVGSAGFNLSRGSFQNLILQGKVKRNDLEVTKPDTEVKPGDIISCRGYGRIQLGDRSETRKGRIAWNIVRYTQHKS